jgi:hypothetical protein
MEWGMAVTGNFFDDIHDKTVFLDSIHSDFYDRSIEMGVEPHWNRGRALDAYFQWLQDLSRIEAVEEKVDKADHLKCAAHLIYWLRRSSPIDEFVYDGELDESKTFMLKYGREYLAFDLGYRAAQVYEISIRGRNLPDDSFSLVPALSDVPRNDFIETMVHVLKTKNVSPHAIFLVLKAIFLKP